MKAEQISQVLPRPAQEVTRRVDPLDVLRDVLELERESKPDLNIDEMMAYAEANPDREIVDSLGAVSVVCAVYHAYTPKDLIPQHLLTHDNLSTLDGLRRVMGELEKRQVKQ